MKRFLQSLQAFFRRLFAFGGRAPICDRCKWNYGDACRRPERPNALTCPDFKAR